MEAWLISLALIIGTSRCVCCFKKRYHVGECATNLFCRLQDELLGLQEREEETQSPQTAHQIDSSVLYRERQAAHGDSSYTPRLVIFDAKGSLGGIPQQHASYLQENENLTSSLAGTWDGRQEVHRAAVIAKSQFTHELEALEEEIVYETKSEREQHLTASSSSPPPPPSHLESAASALDVPGAVNYFTDYLKAPLHPQSMHIVQGLWHGSAELQNWSRPGGWLIAEGGTGGGDSREEASDRIRILAEESDSFSGFQCFVEDLSAWGGMATEVLQEVRDDYGGGRTVAVWALRPSTHTAGISQGELRRHRLREGLSTALLSQQSDVYIPIAAPPPPSPSSKVLFPMLTWRGGDTYHESALLASALDCATLPYRLAVSAGGDGGGAVGALDLWALSNLLTGQFNSPLCALNLAFPCPSLTPPAPETEMGGDSREKQQQHGGHGTFNGGGRRERDASRPFTAAAVGLTGSSLGGSTDTNRFAECIILRGARSQTTSPTTTTTTTTAALSIPAAVEALDAALKSESVRCVQHRTVLGQAQPIPLPYPGIFRPHVSVDGVWCSAVQDAAGSSGGGGHHVASCPVLVRLAGTSSFGAVVKEMGRQWGSAASAAPGRVALEGWGVDKEQANEVAESLHSLSRAYEYDV